ncbi:hypothetical protein LIER_23015 [Lithospermum erythrorhizon]|uniref:Uncharacterized protein n=1 Tax=Lithospermum erythrorhizon TaxID=34254 RepID=A0AAV3R050_LITER
MTEIPEYTLLAPVVLNIIPRTPVFRIPALPKHIRIQHRYEIIYLSSINSLLMHSQTSSSSDKGISLHPKPMFGRKKRAVAIKP